MNNEYKWIIFSLVPSPVMAEGLADAPVDAHGVVRVHDALHALHPAHPGPRVPVAHPGLLFPRLLGPEVNILSILQCSIENVEKKIKV